MGFGHAVARFAQNAACSLAPPLARGRIEFENERNCHDVLECREISLRESWRVHQFDVIVDSSDQRGHAVSLDSVERGLRIPTIQQDHGSAVDERNQDAEVLTCDPEDRQKHQGHRRIGTHLVTARKRRGGRGVNHVALSVLTALGHSRRSARVVQGGEGIEFGGDRSRPLTGDDRLPVAQARIVDLEGQFDGRDRRQHVRHCSLRDVFEWSL